MKPSAIDLFALYHLGLDRKRSYRFRNLSDCAREYQVDAGTVLGWLREHQMDPDTVGQVDYNLTKWHVEAQFVAPEAAEGLIQQAWTGYQEALRRRREPGRFFHDVDYQRIWGDEEPVDRDDLERK